MKMSRSSFLASITAGMFSLFSFPIEAATNKKKAAPPSSGPSVQDQINQILAYLGGLPTGSLSQNFDFGTLPANLLPMDTADVLTGTHDGNPAYYPPGTTAPVPPECQWTCGIKGCQFWSMIMGNGQVPDQVMVSAPVPGISPGVPMGQDFRQINFVSGSPFAHTVTGLNCSFYDGTSATAKHVATFAPIPGSGFSAIAFGGNWYVVGTPRGVTFS